MNAVHKFPKSQARPVPGVGAALKPKSDQTEAFTSAETGEDKAQAVARNQLRAYIERIERLEEEKKTVADDIKEIYMEAKGNGFDTKAIRKVIAARKLDDEVRREQEAIIDIYMISLGMLEE